MSSYSYDEWKSEEVTIDGIIYDVSCHYEGWYSSGSSFGYGCEPPDGEEEITEVEIESARYEETDEEIELTDEVKNSEELKQKIISEIR